MSDFNKINSGADAEKSAETADERVAKLASAYHEDWRKTRENEDGTFDPRVKTTTDEKWIKDHGTDQIDIANSAYDQLPTDWQNDNKEAAKTVENILTNIGGGVNLNDSKEYSDAGTIVHNAWLSRQNPADIAKGGWAHNLNVPFDDLPQDEKDKDIRQVEIGNEQIGYVQNVEKAQFMARAENDAQTRANGEEYLADHVPLAMDGDDQFEMAHKNEAKRLRSEAAAREDIAAAFYDKRAKKADKIMDGFAKNPQKAAEKIAKITNPDA